MGETMTAGYKVCEFLMDLLILAANYRVAGLLVFVAYTVSRLTSCLKSLMIGDGLCGLKLANIETVACS